MIKVLLICSAGMSTSILERSMQEEAKKQHIEAEIIAKGSHEAREIYQNYDVLLIGPQVKYLLRDFKNMISNKQAISSINNLDYALANGAKVLKLALDLQAQSKS